LTAVGLAMVVVFVVLARPQPSVLRAAAMGLVALAAMTSGGRRRGVRSLSAAVLALLLLDTSLARSAGFALSVLATAGIVLLGPGWRDALATWLPVRVAEAIACPLAAQIACTPVVAWLSGQVSMIAVVANLLAGPAVGPATILGFGAAGIALLSADLAQLVGWMAGWPARWIITVATEGAQLPGAANAWPATVTGITVLTVLCVALVVGLHRMLARPIAMVLAVVLLAAVVLRPVGSIGWPPDDWVLVACDVGQGDGLVLRAGPGTAVVVDTGPEPDAIDRCLRELDVQYVPVLVLTHFHADHVGGLAGVLRGRRVGEIEVSPYSSPPAEYRRVVQLAASQGILVRNVSYHERRMVGQVTWTALWPARVPALPTSAGGPSGSAGDEGSPENNASIAMMAEVAGLRLLLTGDLEPEAQRAVVASGVDLRADVLKVAHHGSGQQDPAFVAATGARLAVISVGVDNDYGHPAPRTLDLLTRAGMGVGRTDTGGSVAVVNTDGRLAVAAEGRRQ
jgi:competence protein ComEC